MKIYQRSALAVLGLISIEAFSSTHMVASARINDLTKLLSDVSEQNDRLNDSLENRRTDIMPEDREVIARYYKEVKEHYLAKPLSQVINSSALQALESYENSLRGSFSVSSQEVELMARDSSRPERSKTLAKMCVSKALGLESSQSAVRTLRAGMSSLNSSVQAPINFRSRYISQPWDDQAVTMTALQQLKTLTSKDPIEAIDGCCVQHEVDAGTCSGIKNSASSALRNLESLANLNIPFPAMAPDPLEVSALKASDVAIILRDRGQHQKLKDTRKDEYGDEQDIFTTISQCRDRAESVVREKKPISGTVVSAIGKAVKCSLLPAIATHTFDTEWQKLSLAFSQAQMQGRGWDMNCDPAEIAVWDAMRPTDPNVIAQQWGLPQLANPPYLQDLRMLPPIQVPPTMFTGNAEDYLSVVAAPGLNSYSVANGVTQVRPSNLQSGVVRNSRSSSGRVSRSATNSGARVSASSTRSFYSRGSDRGQGLVQAVRQASSNIKNNVQPQAYAGRMSSGAKNTRAFLSRAATTSTSTRAASSTGNRKEVANTRSFLKAATGVRATRTTSQGILRTLRGSQNRGTGNNIVNNNNQQRAEIVAMVQKYLDNINLTRDRAGTTRSEIGTLIGKRDSIVAELEMKIQNKPPREQGKLVMAARREILEIDRQLGVKKAEYDVYQNAVTEQASLLQRLVTFGPQNTDLVQAVARGTANSGKSNMPSGLNSSSGGRGSVNGAWMRDVFDFLSEKIALVPVAIANNQKEILSYERHWANEWNRFVNEFGGYVSQLQKKDYQNSKKAAELMGRRAQGISEDSPGDLDTETLVSSKMFIDEVLEESDYLLDLQKRGELVLGNDVLTQLRQAREESRLAEESWTQAVLQSKSDLSLGDEANFEVAYGMLPWLVIE